jgi:hypothetical protein
MNELLKDRIAQKAYEKYQSRGSSNGQDFKDWIVAEKEVLEEEAEKKKTALKIEQKVPVKGKKRNN